MRSCRMQWFLSCTEQWQQCERRVVNCPCWHLSWTTTPAQRSKGFCAMTSERFFLLFCLPHFSGAASRSLFVEVAACDMKQLGCAFMFHRAPQMQLCLPRVQQAAWSAPVIAVGRKVMSDWNSCLHTSASINQNYTVSPFLLTAQMVCLGADTVM